MAERKRAVPRGIGKSGRKLWREMTADYELSPAEYRLLEDACREADLIDLIQAEIDGDDFDLTTFGSMGQTVASPLLAEVRQHRSVMKALLSAIKLPDEDSSSSGERSTKARAAAQSRWQIGA